MLTRSFVHVPGVGERRERGLWQRGYTDWNAFLRGHPEGPWRDLIASRLDPERAARDLPRREMWRLATAFSGRVAFLDIETTGLSPGRDGITCVGLSDGERVEALVQGRDLGRLKTVLERFELLVTYNGSCFDLPVLAAAFPEIDFHRFHHIDLRYPLHRLGLKGGLKGVERTLGLARPEEIQGADGYLAVLLWDQHVGGHPRALETLVRYCLEDVVHLIPLLAHAYDRLSAELPLAVAPIGEVGMPSIPFRADGGLVKDLLRRIEGYRGSGTPGG
ncbi:MAG: ribonuclease H-like domain-containing protein [Acidobacteriia bacterium]|nr:ribonuclease H-like domain-containing protein [Terriglobia bacterium]